MTQGKTNRTKILSLITGLITCLALMLGIVFANPTNTARAEETGPRIVVGTITATSNVDEIIGFGKSVVRPTFNIEKDVPAQFSTSGDWQKKTATGGWDDYSGAAFTEGTYRYRTQIRIDSYSGGGTTHVLDKNGITVTVNGVKWADNSIPTVYADYSYDWVFSKEYEVVAPAGTPLDFIKDKKWDIGENYINKPITAFSVADGAAEPATKEITLSVGNTYVLPADREVISVIRATSNIGEKLGYGKPVFNPSFTFTEGEQAKFSNTMGEWYKKAGTAWKRYEDATFTEGTYMYKNQLRIEDEYGRTHVLNKDGVSVYIDGELRADNQKPDAIYNTYSYIYVGTVDYEVVKPITVAITEEHVPVTDLTKTYNETAQEPTFGGTLVRGADYEVSYEIKTGLTGGLDFDGKPVDAGTYVVTVTGKGAYEGSFTKEFVINKAERSAVPVGLIANPISCREGFGNIDGVTTAMEYRKVGDADYTACASSTITGLEAGEYEVRYAEDDNYLASGVVTVTLAVSHNFGELIAEVPATCNAGGMKAHYCCSDCGKYFDESKKETTEAGLTIDVNPDAHTLGTLIEEVPATCKAGGMKAHYKCVDCGQYFDETKNKTTEEALKTPISPYYGHDFGGWVEEKYATCQAPGRKGYKHCSICDKDYDASNTEITDFVIPVDPDGHVLDDLVEEVSATCKNTGVKAHRDCKLCGKHCDPITRKEIADLTIPITNDHTYGELIPEVPATAEKTGTKKHYKCSVCEKLFDENKKEVTAANLIIPKIGTHKVTVNGGTGGGEYEEGASVTITATVPTGKRFAKWTSESGVTFADEMNVTTTFTMPAGDVTVAATFEDETYIITVIKGTAIPEMAIYQTEVTVKANEPETDMYFDKWKVEGLDTTGMDLTKTEITFRMPAGNVTFEATYLSVTKYGIVIVDGTKDKEVAKAGETITITAGTKEGKVFDKWTCETAGVIIEFKSATSAKTTFVMPACEIEIKAHFRDVDAAPSIEIKVKGGTGAGVVKKGESITVTANEPAEGKEFVGWQDESGKIVSAQKEYTFKVTDEKTLTAVYKNKTSGGGDITPTPDKKDGLSGGQIAGIVIGTVAVAGLGGFAIVWFVVKKKSFADLIEAIKGLFAKKE